MENYLNILFIRLRPSGRYIFRRGRQVFEVVRLVKAGKRWKTKEKLWRRMVERGWDGGRKREYEEETEGRIAWRRVVTRRKGRGRSGRRCLCLEFITQWYHFVPRRSQATPGTNPGEAEPQQSGWHHGILLPVMLKQFPLRVLTCRHTNKSRRLKRSRHCLYFDAFKEHFYLILLTHKRIFLFFTKLSRLFVPL